jgi:hypothetical protein
MTSIHDPDPSPEVETTRLAYLCAVATADGEYAKFGQVYAADRAAEAAYEAYADAWNEAHAPSRGYEAEPDVEAGAEL